MASKERVAGAAQGLDSIERVAGMGVMGMGGLLSAVGGFMFIVIVLRALLTKQNDQFKDNSDSRLLNASIHFFK